LGRGRGAQEVGATGEEEEQTRDGMPAEEELSFVKLLLSMDNCK